MPDRYRNRAARFERARCFVVRCVVRALVYTAFGATRLLPKCHPGRTFADSFTAEMSPMLRFASACQPRKSEKNWRTRIGWSAFTVGALVVFTDVETIAAAVIPG